MHCITLHYITLHYITLHYIYITWHHITLHCIPLHYTLVENKTKREHPQVSLFHVKQFAGKATVLALTETKRKREEVKRGREAEEILIISFLGGRGGRAKSCCLSKRGCANILHMEDQAQGCMHSPFAMQDRLVENKTKREHPQVSLFHVNQFVGKAKALALTETKRKREEVKRGWRLKRFKSSHSTTPPSWRQRRLNTTHRKIVVLPLALRKRWTEVKRRKHSNAVLNIYSKGLFTSPPSCMGHQTKFCDEIHKSPLLKLGTRPLEGRGVFVINRVSWMMFDVVVPIGFCLMCF